MQRPRFLLHAVRILDDVLFWPALGVVIWGELAWMPGQGMFGWLADIDDKILHFIAYSALGGMAAAGIKERRWVAWAALGLILLGGALEFVQSYVGRDKSIYDALANTAGVAFGAVAGRFIVEPLRKRFPS